MISGGVLPDRGHLRRGSGNVGAGVEVDLGDADPIQ
jgi:hypothetical protein